MKKNRTCKCTGTMHLSPIIASVILSEILSKIYKNYLTKNTFFMYNFNCTTSYVLNKN
jgi:hypothetical protein